MRFHIEHATRYSFSRPVFLEPHLIRLTPRSDAWQHCLSHSIAIEPSPAGTSSWTDVEGNQVVQAWFEHLTDNLTVTLRSEVETFKSNPYDFLPVGFDTLPVEYGDDAGRLSVFLEFHDDSRPLREFVNAIVHRVGPGAAPFINALNATVYESIRTCHRESGEPWSPEETLVRKEGACRDLAVLFVAACRSQGIAARFVSGYQEGDPEGEDRDLHAWAEVYLPGGGWRGYDPSHGLAVSDRHVAVAASANPALAAPVSGSFRGTGVTSTMRFNLRVAVSA